IATSDSLFLNWKNCFEEELICPICLHVFVEPIQLPCKHNFCRGCISEAWAKDTGLVRCPECNHAYNQKPNLEKNIKLTNIVEKFNALNAEKAPAILQCILCRRGPPLPAQKVCLRCNAPCCQSHVQTHLQQPSPNPGHLLVDAEDVRAWSCPQHDEYRLYHCEAEQVAVCQYCCFSRCAASHGHAVCDVEVRRNDIRFGRCVHMCMSTFRVCVCACAKDKVEQLKEEVRMQYQKMQQLLEEDLGKTLEVLERLAQSFARRTQSQALQLNERRQEAKKMLSSVQVLFDKADDINFMKNTKSVKILMDRSQTCTGSGATSLQVGHLNSKVFLSEISKKEKSLRKMLEVPLAAPAHFLQSVPVYPCSMSGSTPEKRKHSAAFPESATSFLESSSSGPVAKQQFLGPSSSSADGTSAQPPLAPCSSTQHVVGLGSSGAGAQPVHHSSSVFGPAHYPNAGSSQQAVLPQYSGRKILMCTVDNCYCSSVPNPRSGSFPWTQEYSHPLPSTPSISQPLQGLSMRDWIDASQSHRHPDFYGLYGQSSAKHYVTS
uniref:E3 ubiquitin-protein ligase TRIM8 n=1 Tax=Electrophorus electricus TaxID=8005 RepID=A0AAY5ELA2_ELEEL